MHLVGERPVVGDADLAHQRRVGREARDARVAVQREHAVEVGPVRKDLYAQSLDAGRRRESGRLRNGRRHRAAPRVLIGVLDRLDVRCAACQGWRRSRPTPAGTRDVGVLAAAPGPWVALYNGLPARRPTETVKFGGLRALAVNQLGRELGAVTRRRRQILVLRLVVVRHRDLVAGAVVLDVGDLAGRPVVFARTRSPTAIGRSRFRRFLAAMPRSAPLKDAVDRPASRQPPRRPSSDDRLTPYVLCRRAGRP